ncbi:hypothetical protein CL618_02210 [archaeon]|nr:hypothetical protein [archaeon]|tara:strand:- start:6254 stop:6454 length:201 start_codon:yes stop_codon:yes gene_type:complete
MELYKQMRGMLEYRLDMIIGGDEGRSLNFEKMLWLLEKIGKYDVDLYVVRYERYLEDGERKDQRTF